MAKPKIYEHWDFTDEDVALNIIRLAEWWCSRNSSRKAFCMRRYGPGGVQEFAHNVWIRMSTNKTPTHDIKLSTLVINNCRWEMSSRHNDPVLGSERLPKQLYSDQYLMEHAFHQELSALIDDILKSIGERLRLIIRMRYGLDGEEPRSLESVGRILKITRSRVWELELKALNRLQTDPSRKTLHMLHAELSST